MSENKLIEGDPTFLYILNICLYIGFALVLGIWMDRIVDIIGKKFGLNIHIKVVIQIFLIAVVIYFLKNISNYIHQEPKSNYSYDIMFISIFLTSQANFADLLQKYK